MSLLSAIVSTVKAVSNAANAYKEGSTKKTKSTSSKSTSSYTPIGNNTDDQIRKSNANDYNAIQAYKSAYDTAKANGDIAGMSNANAGANAVRAKYGYSGGSDGSDYIELKTNNPYEEAMNEVQNKYDEIGKQQKVANELSVKQGTERLEKQKDTINQGYDENARQAYIAAMQSKKNLPQQLAASGINGGATETANLGIQTNYENNLNTINNNRANTINDIDTAINELKNNGDLSAVEAALSNSQQALAAYQNMIGNKISYDSATKANDLQKQLDTIGQYSDDYMAEINRRNAIDPNDPLIPYLVAARQEKINNQKLAEQDAQKAETEQEQELAWKLFQELGKSNAYIEMVLGIPQGTTTMDYTKNQYDINKPYYKPSTTKEEEIDNEVNYNVHKSIIDNNFAISDAYGNIIGYDKQGIKDYLEAQNTSDDSEKPRLSDKDARSLLSYYGISY